MIGYARIAVLVGVLGFAAVGWWGAQRIMQFAGAVETTGRVVAFDTRDDIDSRGDPVRYLYPQVRFTTAGGQAVTFRGDGGSTDQGYAIGAVVRVMYQPEHPEQAEIDDWLDRWGAILAVGAFPAFALLWGISVLIADARFRDRRATGDGLEVARVPRTERMPQRHGVWRRSS
jgi:hypothetical protein